MLPTEVRSELKMLGLLSAELHRGAFSSIASRRKLTDRGITVLDLDCDAHSLEQ